MISLLKFLIVLILAVVVTGIVVTTFPKAKQSVTEFINPASKEVRLLGELENNLTKLQSKIVENQDVNDTNSKNLKDSLENKTQEELYKKETELIIEESKAIISQIKTISEKKSSVVTGSLSKIGDIVTSPFSSEDNIASVSYQDSDGNQYTCSLIK